MSILDRQRDYWKVCFWHPSGKAYPTDEAIAFPDEKLKPLLQEVRDYRYKVFEPDQIEIMELEDFGGLDVLEIGCGAGHDSITMAQHGAKVTAVDIVPSNIEFVKRCAELLGVELEAVHVDDLLNLQVDEKFDIIFAYGCLHHIPNAREVVAHISQFLKEDGEWVMMLYTPVLTSGEGPNIEGLYIHSYAEETVVPELFGHGWELTRYEVFHKGTYAAVEVKRR